MVNEAVVPGPVYKRPPQLILPSPDYAAEYVAMLREHQAKGRFMDSRHIDNNVARISRDFASFVGSLNAASEPENVRPGYVPERHYWLLVDGHLLGRSTLRFDLAEAPELRDLGHIGYDIRPSAEGHGWGRRLLSLTLEKAVEYRLEKVLLTCDSNNLASKRIIEACGGVFEKSVPILGRTYERLRYWIDLQIWEPARKYV